MIKDKTIELANEAIQIELANAKHEGEFVDMQHTYAILKEEIEEAKKNFSYLKSNLEGFLPCVRKLRNKKISLLFILNRAAIMKIRELTQVIAVIQKAQEKLNEGLEK